MKVMSNWELNHKPTLNLFLDNMYLLKKVWQKIFAVLLPNHY